ncbi:MAG: hypothetical protein MUO78_08250, partial [candidate division Zixibacteria bacterium]|nr:hypothetical protein [candidate division Zixibacteria bacterium]
SHQNWIRQGKVDGLVKSPSAALRFNFVVAAHLVSAVHFSFFARLASGSFYETIVPVTFYEIIKVKGGDERNAGALMGAGLEWIECQGFTPWDLCPLNPIFSLRFPPGAWP